MKELELKYGCKQNVWKDCYVKIRMQPEPETFQNLHG